MGLTKVNTLSWKEIKALYSYIKKKVSYFEWQLVLCISAGNIKYIVVIFWYKYIIESLYSTRRNCTVFLFFLLCLSFYWYHSLIYFGEEKKKFGYLGYSTDYWYTCGVLGFWIDLIAFRFLFLEASYCSRSQLSTLLKLYKYKLL